MGKEDDSIGGARMISPGIFREYDIRGVVDVDLTKDVARLIGWAFAKYLEEHAQPSDNMASDMDEGLTVTVGRDVRLHSEKLCNGLIEGITTAGVNVIDIGVCPTPLLYFSLYNTNVDGGIMITGSHNPPEFNGLKLCVGKEALYGDSIQEIRKIVERENPAFDETTKIKMLEKVEYIEIIPFYLNYLREQFVFQYQIIEPPIKVVVDSGNGTAGAIAPIILREMGCDVIELFSEPDGYFPNHHPDPTIPENLETLIKTVKDNKADLGVAYDGDADRIGVVDEKGEIVWGDRLMIIYARDILKEWPGTTFVSEVKASQVLYDEISRAGGNPIMWKAGHSLIKAKMREVEAVLGAEVSGHIFFADRFYGYDDAIYATCRLIEILKRERLIEIRKMKEQGLQGEVKRGISFLLQDVPTTITTPEIRVPCPDEKKFQVVEVVKEIFSQGKPPADRPPVPVRDVITVDGIRVVFDGGWGLIRPSNTQPVLVLRFEADSEEKLATIMGYMEEVLNSVTT